MKIKYQMDVRPLKQRPCLGGKTEKPRLASEIRLVQIVLKSLSAPPP